MKHGKCRNCGGVNDRYCGTDSKLCSKCKKTPQRLHVCEVCGKESTWQKGWFWVMCPSKITGQFPVRFCSDACCTYWHDNPGEWLDKPDASASVPELVDVHGEAAFCAEMDEALP